MIRKMVFSVMALLFSVVIVFSQISTPQVLSSNMILQQGQVVPIWGNALPKERVKVSFGNQSKATRADENGNWKIELQPMKANKTPQQMVIQGEKSTITYENILIGEVWLCSGQSNMEYAMKPHPSFLPPLRGTDFAALELEKPTNEMIRVFNCMRGDSSCSWQVAGGKTLVNTSAVGYFFGKNIQEKLEVPVGIVSAAIGGTQIEAWTTSKTYEESDTFSTEIKTCGGKVGGYIPGDWYQKIIAPLVPYAVKGFLWYQGENNCGKRDKLYAQKFKVLVESWRATFNVSNAPFYSVLLAPHIYSDRLHNKKTYPVTAEDLPIFREQQIQAASLVSNSDYVVISDLIDYLTDIHPSYKWEVGARLAQVALAKTYCFADIAWSGPRLTKAETLADSIVVTFDHCEAGLKTSDGKRLSWFEIAAKNGIFRPAFADIKGINKVVVYHPEIKQPTQVRLGWHETAIPNLVNSENLPATPFNSSQQIYKSPATRNEYK